MQQDLRTAAAEAALGDGKAAAMPADAPTSGPQSAQQSARKGVLVCLLNSACMLYPSSQVVTMHGRV